MTMIGNNELRLCKAEMKVALQGYLDARMGEWAPLVNDVEERDHMFRVSLVERKVCPPGLGTVCEPGARQG